MGKKSKLIPEKIAGLRVPEKLRKSKMLLGLLANAQGREIVSSALTAGAAAVAVALAATRDDTRKGVRGLVSNALHDGAGAIMRVVAGAARTMLPDQPAPSAPAKAPKADKRKPRTDKPGLEAPTH